MVRVITVQDTVAVMFGLGTATGLLLIAVGWRDTRSSIVHGPGGWRDRGNAWARRLRDGRWVTRGVFAISVGLLAGVATGWPVGAVLTVVAVWFLPRLIGPDRAHARRLARVEAVASWTEMLRDVLSAAAGLEQAILVTAPVAPAAIRGEITALAQRLENGQRLAPALRCLSEELSDPTADLVIAALVLSAEHQARRLGELLGSLAATAREQAAMRMRIETSRARIRTSVRVIVATTLAFAVGVVVFNRGYLAAYDTSLGQAVLLFIGIAFAAAFTWLARISTDRDGHRALAIPAPGAPPALIVGG